MIWECADCGHQVLGSRRPAECRHCGPDVAFFVPYGSRGSRSAGFVSPAAPRARGARAQLDSRMR